MIRVPCPGCGRDLEFADFLAGLTAVCKSCNHRVPLPAASGKAPVAADAVQSGRPEGADAAGPRQKLSPSDAIRPGSLATPPAPAVDDRLVATGAAAKAPVAAGPTPESAVEQARLLLDGGMSVPEIEQKLVARGLFPEAATAAVNAALGDRARRQNEAVESERRLNLIHRILSAVVGSLYLLLVFVTGGWVIPGSLSLFAVACIWFPKAMPYFRRDDVAGVAGRGVVIRWAGWVFLLLLIAYRLVILYYLVRHVAK